MAAAVIIAIAVVLGALAGGAVYRQVRSHMELRESLRIFDSKYDQLMDQLSAAVDAVSLDVNEEVTSDSIGGPSVTILEDLIREKMDWAYAWRDQFAEPGIISTFLDDIHADRLRCIHNRYVLLPSTGEIYASADLVPNEWPGAEVEEHRPLYRYMSASFHIARFAEKSY